MTLKKNQDITSEGANTPVAVSDDGVLKKHVISLQSPLSGDQF